MFCGNERVFHENSTLTQAFGVVSLSLAYVAKRRSVIPSTARLEEYSLAVKIRLARHGAKKRPFYRVVVADARSPRDGRLIEQVGTYNPVADPKVINIDLEKVDAWLAKGAQPTEAVANLIAVARGEKPMPEPKAKKSKKQLAKEAAAREAAE